MTEPLNWGDTAAGQLARAMGGTRPGTAELSPRRSEAESRELHREWESRMDQADKLLGLTGADTWRGRREAAEQIAAEARSRGNWFGSAVACGECQAEETRGAVIEKVDHACFREDMRMQHRLNAMAAIYRAERDGSIQHGMTNPPDAGFAAMQRQHEAHRQSLPPGSPR